MQGGRQGVTLIEGLRNGAARLAHSGIVDSDAEQAAGTEGQGAAEHRSEQGWGLPRATGVEEVFPGPTTVLAAVGPDDARQAAPAQAHQGTQGLADGAVKGTRLRETGAPVGHEGEPSGEQGPGASGRRPNVFLSVRMKRSPRAIFLVREETRLSRSTVR